MNRRIFLALLVPGAAACALCGCAADVTPAQIAADIAAEAQGLSTAVKLLPAGLPPASSAQIVRSALTELTVIASALSGADMPDAATISAVQDDIETVVGALNGIVPANVQTYLTAAAALLPVILAGVQTAFPGALSAQPIGKNVILAAESQPGLTIAQARAILLTK